MGGKGAKTGARRGLRCLAADGMLDDMAGAKTKIPKVAFIEKMVAETVRLCGSDPLTMLPRNSLSAEAMENRLSKIADESWEDILRLRMLMLAMFVMQEQHEAWKYDPSLLIAWRFECMRKFIKAERTAKLYADEYARVSEKWMAELHRDPKEVGGRRVVQKRAGEEMRLNVIGLLAVVSEYLAGEENLSWMVDLSQLHKRLMTEAAAFYDKYEPE
ncbi:MAG: hypothetical protein RL272_1095 [Candidatus Parcubacteria bacterium]|jgi:hypothetical protein